jgi:SAM-dependent methyltransferase
MTGARDPLEPPTERRRLSFGSVAEQYDAARPSYPATLIDDVVSYAGAVAGSAALEVGAGTGKATELFAARGLSVLALEPSAEMAALAARRCAAFSDVSFSLTDFESASLEPAGGFQLVYSAQAWHWVTPELRYQLARRALRRSGALAAFWNRTDWSRSELRSELGDAYARSGAVLEQHGPMYPGAAGPLDFGDTWAEQLEAAGRFDDLVDRTYPWTCSYTAAEYVALLGTHSDHIVLEDSVRARLFDEVTAEIERAGGSLTMAYDAQLCLARAA